MVFGVSAQRLRQLKRKTFLNGGGKRKTTVENPNENLVGSHRSALPVTPLSYGLIIHRGVFITFKAIERQVVWTYKENAFKSTITILSLDR